MQTIRPEFHENAWQTVFGRGHGNASQTDSESDTQADSGGLLSLEMQDNSFQVLMNRIDWLMNTGLGEDMLMAYEMTRRAWQERDFGDKIEEKLQAKLDHIIELMNEQRELGSVFTKKAIGLAATTPAATAPAANANGPAASAPSVGGFSGGMAMGMGMGGGR